MQENERIFPFHVDGDEERRAKALKEVNEIRKNLQTGKKLPRLCSCGDYVPHSLKLINCKHCGGEPNLQN